MHINAMCRFDTYKQGLLFASVVVHIVPTCIHASVSEPCGDQVLSGQSVTVSFIIAQRALWSLVDIEDEVKISIFPDMRAAM